jgi:cytochrome b involved in lipid metabolism
MSYKSETGGTSGSSPSAHAPKQIPYSEVQKHANADSCWVIIEGQVYDVTSFLSDHPGGAGVIVKNSGRDATYVLRLVSNTWKVMGF